MIHDEDKLPHCRFVSVMSNLDRSLVMVYVPEETKVQLYNPFGIAYSARWFDPKTGEYRTASLEVGINSVSIPSPAKEDFVLVLESQR